MRQEQIRRQIRRQRPGGDESPSDMPTQINSTSASVSEGAGSSVEAINRALGESS